MDHLGNIFYSLVDEIVTGMADNDPVLCALQSRSLDYPTSLPLMPRHELNKEKMGQPSSRYESTCGSCSYATRGCGLAWLQII